MDRVVHFTKEYHNQTTLHPLGAAIFAVLAALMLGLPRRYAPLALFGLVCFVATAQRIAIAGIDFDLLRLMILVGHLRIFWRGEFTAFKWKPIDIAVVAWWSLSALSYIMLHANLLDLFSEDFSPETRSAVIYQCGLFLDHVLLYFLFRLLIREWNDVDSIVRCLMWVSIPVALAFIVEKQTGRNLFSVFGGVPEMTLVREGRLRCQGAFAHPIIAGVFFATMLPLVAVQWWKPRADRRLVFLAVSAFMVIIYACSSSTPVMAVFFAGFGAAMFIFRKSLGFFRWGTFFTLVFLHFAMEKPVWHLIARLSNFLGGTGWHRFHLIDEWVNHTSEWFLLGTKSTMHWGWGLSDVTNQYVFEAVSGGILGFLMFLWILGLCFQAVGRLWREHHDDNRYRLLFSWALGCSLFAHCMSFISVAYFGQAKVIWFMLLAAIATLAPNPRLLYRRAYSPKVRTRRVDPYAVYNPATES